MKIATFKLLVCIILSATLSSCSNVRSTLGLQKGAPDEFVIISNPPLSQPPDFTLPEPGISILKEQEKANLKSEDELFLKSLDTKVVTTSTRVLLEQEKFKAETEEQKDGFLKRSIRNFKNPRKDQVIDAYSERERLLKKDSEGSVID